MPAFWLLQDERRGHLRAGTSEIQALGQPYSRSHIKQAAVLGFEFRSARFQNPCFEPLRWGQKIGFLKSVNSGQSVVAFRNADEGDSEDWMGTAGKTVVIDQCGLPGCRRRESVRHAFADPAPGSTARERPAGLCLIHVKMVSDFKERKVQQN